MNRSIIALLHAGYWLLYWFLFTFLYFISRATTQSLFDEDWAIVLLLTSLTGFVSFYAFYSWLVPRYLTQKRLQAFAGYGLLVCFVTGLLTTQVIAGTVYTIASIFPEIDSQLALLLMFTGLAVVNGILATIIRGFITWYADIRIREALLNKNLQTELALLKAQINPHFLFNTLNNIDILIERDAPTASKYLNKLSDMLRFILYETQADTIPLTKELEYIEKYIELQKIRTTNGAYVQLEIVGQDRQHAIAPMLFIPYIENAFKYATNKKVVNAIEVRIRIEEKQVCFWCSNAFDSNKAIDPMSNGLGNRLLKQRLDLLYKDRYILDIQTSSNRYSVDLRLQLHD